MSKAKKIIIVFLVFAFALLPCMVFSVSASNSFTIQNARLKNKGFTDFQIRKTDGTVSLVSSFSIDESTFVPWSWKMTISSDVEYIRYYIPLVDSLKSTSFSKGDYFNYSFRLIGGFVNPLIIDSVHFIDDSGNAFVSRLNLKKNTTFENNSSMYSLTTDIDISTKLDTDIKNISAIMIQFYNYSATNSGNFRVGISDTFKISSGDYADKIVDNQNDNASDIIDNQDKSASDIIDNQKENTQAIIDNQNQLQENEKTEANQGGNEGVGELTEVIPSDTDGILNAFSSLINSMLHTNTECVISFPQIKTPAIGGLIPSYTLSEAKEVDFEETVDLIPVAIMSVVRALLTIALIIFCFKELYSTISYVLTLKGGDGE